MNPYMTIYWPNNVKRKITKGDKRRNYQPSTKGNNKRLREKKGNSATPCEGRTLKELGRLARCSLDDGL